MQLLFLLLSSGSSTHHTILKRTSIRGGLFFVEFVKLSLCCVKQNLQVCADKNKKLNEPDV